MNLGLGPDSLTVALLGACHVAEPNELIALFHGNTGRRFWASMSHLAFEAAAQGHPESNRMIEQAAADLAALAVDVASQISCSGPVVLGGGLGVNQPRLQQSFRHELSAHGLNDVRVLDQEPVFGVLELASDPKIRGLRPASGR
jgi:N-acetylglucosamine kinase-like BadF-type ATPase